MVEGTETEKPVVKPKKVHKKKLAKQQAKKEAKEKAAASGEIIEKKVKKSKKKVVEKKETAEAAEVKSAPQKKKFNDDGEEIVAEAASADKSFPKKGKKIEGNGTEQQQSGKGKKAGQPLVKHCDGTSWTTYQVNEKATEVNDGLAKEEYEKIFQEATILLTTDSDQYSRYVRTQGGSEAAWLQTAITSGTARDRMTAMQLMIKKSPVHSCQLIRQVLVHVEKKGTREAVQVLPIVEQLFVEDLLPEDRKLVPFSQRPLTRLTELSSGNDLTRQRILAVWMFEHELKQIYLSFVQALATLAAGSTEGAALRALNTIKHLLAERPEAEQHLLSALCNKLGHPNYKVGARAARLLEELGVAQPNMRPVLVGEVERVIYRKNVSDSALLYGSTFLSQIALRDGENDLAVKMLSIYFGLFKSIVARRKTNSRLLKILLAAAYRAFPFAKGKAEDLVADIDALYKMVHTSPFHISLQTLKLLYQVLHISDSVNDRFFSALYRKLLSPIPGNQYNEFFLLLFKALSSDSVVNRVRAMVKRILQIAVNESPPFAAAALILISKLREKRPNVVLTTRTAERAPNEGSLPSAFDNDDEEEVFVDLDDTGKPVQKIKIDEVKPMEQEDEKEVVEKKNLKGKLAAPNTQGWVHKNFVHRGAVTAYDHGARNPMFVDCSDTVDSELKMLAKHFHPSVVVFANAIIKGEPIAYSGDPLTDFTTITFLDRFVYRNPKDPSKRKGDDKVMRKKTYDPWGVRKLKVTSKEFINTKEENIPADEKYLYRYATLNFDTKKTEDLSDIESVSSHEFDKMLDRFNLGEDVEVDFTKAYTSEKSKQGKKRKAANPDIDDESDEDSDSDEDMEGGGEDGAGSFHADEEEDDDWDDDEDIGEDDEDDDGGEDEGAFGGGASSKSKKGFLQDDSDSEDEDLGDADALVSADRFAEMLEDAGDDDEGKKNKKGKKMMRGGVNRGGGRGRGMSRGRGGARMGGKRR